MRYAVEKNLWDTELNEEDWSTASFKFLAGDLYEVIPKLKDRYSPTTKLQGDCKASLSGFFSDSFRCYDNETIRATVLFNCRLYYHSDELVNFSALTEFVLTPKPTLTEMNF